MYTKNWHKKRKITKGQDLTPSEYELLVAVNEEKPVFNIYGDTYQLLKYKRGIDDWKKVLSIIGETVEQRVLNANYRNTNQIISYFNNSLKMDIIPIGQDGHNVKDINRYSFERTLSKLKMSEERIAIILPRKVDKNKYLDYEQISYEVKKRIGDEIGNGKIAIVYVDEVKGIEFDRVFVVPNGMTKNERYIAYTRALSDLTIVVDESLDDMIIKKRDEKKSDEKNRKENRAYSKKQIQNSNMKIGKVARREVQTETYNNN